MSILLRQSSSREGHPGKLPMGRFRISLPAIPVGEVVGKNPPAALLSKEKAPLVTGLSNGSGGRI